MTHLRNRLKLAAFAALPAAPARPAAVERHPDCMSSYGPSGCNRVRCQLGKKCAAEIDRPTDQWAAAQGTAAQEGQP